MNIKGLREQLGLTQKEFAARVKVDAITVSRWERGIQRPSAQVQKRINRLLKQKIIVAVDYKVEGEGNG